MHITFSKSDLPKSGVVVLPVYADGAKTRMFETLDASTDGALTRAMKARSFAGKKGQTLEISAPHGLDNSVVCLIGAGKEADVDALAAEALGGAAVARYLRGGEKTLLIGLDGFAGNDAEMAARVAFGARLRAYSFDKYRTTAEKEDLPSLAKIAVHTPEATAAKSAYEAMDKIADGVFLTRDLVSEPANILYPESFAERCRELASLGIKVEILNETQMRKLGMGSLLGVGQGSARDSRLAVMKWMGGKANEAPVCFIGKGVCFDTGGISLKPGPGMGDMKWDMGGAGAVTGAMAALAGRKAKANVIGILGLVENMPDGNAIRPGDILTSMSGKTIEVLNTDAEGRLVMADALTYAQEKFKPKAVLDVATLTGAIIIALAHEYAGVFTYHDELADQLEAAGKATGDATWRMPVTKVYEDMIKSDIADIKNISSGREGGSSTAAAFLKQFIQEGVPWAHIDIAGMAWSDKDKPTSPKGGTGYGVRLLDEFIRANYEG